MSRHIGLIFLTFLQNGNPRPLSPQTDVEVKYTPEKILAAKNALFFPNRGVLSG